MQNITHMLTFAEVVQHGTFTAAAEALGLSQPLVSRQISQLETHLGVRLLNRSTRRLHLTEAGELFYDYCQRIAHEAKAAETAVMPMQEVPHGLLRITAPQCLTQSLLTHAINDFQTLNPEVDVELSVSGRMVNLIDENIDLALRLGELQDSNLIARHLSTATFIVCASPDYWQQHGKPKHPRDLSQHDCMIYSEKPNPDHWLFKDKNEAIKVTVKSRFRSDDASLLLNMAIMNKGVIYAPSFMFHEALQNEELVAVLQDYYPSSMGLYAVYPHAKHMPPKTRAFVDFLFSDIAAPYVQELSFKEKV